VQTTLSGIILFVHDVDKLKQFYTEHLHLVVIEAIQGEWVLLKAGNCELGLHKIGADYTQSNDGQENNCKIVFDIAEDIVTIHKQLEAKGVALREIKTWDNFPYWVCDGEDPEGNVFQLRMKKPSS